MPVKQSRAKAGDAQCQTRYNQRQRYGGLSQPETPGCTMAPRNVNQHTSHDHASYSHPRQRQGLRDNADRRVVAAPSAAHKIPLFQRNVVQRVVRGHFSEFYFLARSLLVRSTRPEKRK